MSLCLNMIVKNESHIIRKTLENICQSFPISYWVISDTGSSDNTIEIIEQFFKEKNIPGQIHEAPWQDFSHNRNVALEQCANKAEYVLFFDADDYVVGSLQLPELSKDAYLFQFKNEAGTTEYLRKLIVKNNGHFKWRSVLHEYLYSDNNPSLGYITGDYAIISGRKGNRSLNKNKYKEDAEILEKAYIKGDDHDLLPRYAFYCAQSYRDAKITDEAIKWYKIRISSNQGWQDEKYCSYKELGLLFEKKNDYDQALHYWLEGTKLDPLRAECWYHLARRHSWNKEPHIAYQYAKQASAINMPKGNRLFVKANIYKYWSYYELCLNAYKLGKIEESYQAFKKLTVHGTKDLIDRLEHQFKDYRSFILNDDAQSIQELLINLKRLKRLKLLNNLLLVQSIPLMSSIEQTQLRIQTANDKLYGIKK